MPGGRSVRWADPLVDELFEKPLVAPGDTLERPSIGAAGARPAVVGIAREPLPDGEPFSRWARFSRPGEIVEVLEPEPVVIGTSPRKGILVHTGRGRLAAAGALETGAGMRRGGRQLTAAEEMSIRQQEEMIPRLLPGGSRGLGTPPAEASPTGGVRDHRADSAPAGRTTGRTSAAGMFGDSSPGPGRCWNCRRVGHRYPRCPEPRVMFCRMCGRHGFTAKTCPNCGEAWRRMGPYRPELHRNVRRRPEDYGYRSPRG